MSFLEIEMTASSDSMPASPDAADDCRRHARFELGRVVVTPGALQLLEQVGINVFDLLARHASGDWGDVCAEDAKVNEYAVINGGRVLSVYTLVPGSEDERVWIITEHDRSVTTVLRPDEY